MRLIFSFRKRHKHVVEFKQKYIYMYPNFYNDCPEKFSHNLLLAIPFVQHMISISL